MKQLPTSNFGYVNQEYHHTKVQNCKLVRFWCQFYMQFLSTDRHVVQSLFSVRSQVDTELHTTQKHVSFYGNQLNQAPLYQKQFNVGIACSIWTAPLATRRHSSRSYPLRLKIVLGTSILYPNSYCPPIMSCPIIHPRAEGFYELVANFIHKCTISIVILRLCPRAS